MSNINFTIATWSDSLGNYYGKVLFGPDFLSVPGTFGNEQSAIGPTPSAVKKQLTQSLRLCVAKVFREELEEYLKTENEVRQCTLRIKVRPSNQARGLFVPVDNSIEISTTVFYCCDPDGSIQVECPLENMSFSSMDSDSYRRIVSDALSHYYKDQPPTGVFLQSAQARSIRCVKDTISIPFPKRNNSGEEFSSEPTLLPQIATPMNKKLLRNSFMPPWGRTEQLNALINCISQMSTGIIIVGPAGCGKSTLLAAAVRQLEKAYRLRNTEENRSFGWKFCENRFWQTNANRLIAGTKWYGEWQQRIENVVNELNEFQGILCLEDIATLMGSKDEPENGPAGFLAEYLNAGEVRIICEATPDELDRIRSQVPSFVESLELFPVDAMDASQAKNALEQMEIEYKKMHPKFEFELGVAASICELCRRFYRYDSYPGSASRYWQRLIKKREKHNIDKLNVKDVYSEFVNQSGLPSWLFRDEQQLSFDSLCRTLAKRVVGQPEACEVAAQAVLKFKTALNNPGKPIASFLFCGPTGVGKTQLAKTLAEYMFGNQFLSGSNPEAADQKESDNAEMEEALEAEGLYRQTSSETNRRLHRNVSSHNESTWERTENKERQKKEVRLFRLDMSEYQNPYSAQRLIETPTGRPSPLIEYVRRHPFCVILFDEIEKAALEAFDILLNLLDEGRLTDRLGRTTSFQNSIIIMTSNLGGVTRPDLGFGMVDSETRALQNQRQYFKAAMDFFRPEFVNRIDQLVAFRSLDITSSAQIVELELADLVNREGLSEKKLSLQVSKSLKEHLTKTGFDPVFGARPLQRKIESLVVARLSRFLTNQPDLSNSTILLDWSKEGEVVSSEQ